METRSVLELEVSQQGRTSRFSLTPEQFSTKEWWLEHLGPRAIVYPIGTRPRPSGDPVACPTTSKSAMVKTHTGWTQIDGAWCFLTASGAIGADGLRSDVEVNPPWRPGSISSCPSRRPVRQPRRGGAREPRARVGLAPDKVMVPLLGAVYRAPLDGLRLRPVHRRPDRGRQDGAARRRAAALRRRRCPPRTCRAAGASLGTLWSDGVRGEGRTPRRSTTWRRTAASQTSCAITGS